MATEVISRTQAEFESIKHLGGDEESTELRGLAIDVVSTSIMFISLFLLTSATDPEPGRLRSVGKAGAQRRIT